MDKATKQYRQYIFKVNHKLSRKAAKMGNTTYADSMKVRGMLKAASKVAAHFMMSSIIVTLFLFWQCIS